MITLKTRRKINGDVLTILLRIVLWIRFACGFYCCDLFPSTRSRIIASFYSITNFIILSKTIIFHADFYPSDWKFFLMILLFSGHVFSCFTSESAYFSSVKSRCATKKSMRLLLISVLCPFIVLIVYSVSQIALIVWFCTIFKSVCKNETLGVIVISLGTAIISFNSFSKLLPVCLLYCDIQSLLDAVRGSGGVDADRYTFLYDQIHTDFRRQEHAIKPMILLGVAVLFLRILFTVKNIISSLSPENHDAVMIASAYALIAELWSSISGFLPGALLEMAAKAQEDLVVYMLNQRMVTTDPTTHAKLSDAIQFVRSRPLRYTFLKAFPFDGQLIISMFSLMVTYIIAVIQLTKIN